MSWIWSEGFVLDTRPVDIIYVHVWGERDHTSVYALGNPFSLRPMVEVSDPAFVVFSLCPRQHEERPGESWGQQTRFHCQQTGWAVTASYCILTGDLKIDQNRSSIWVNCLMMQHSVTSVPFFRITKINPVSILHLSPMSRWYVYKKINSYLWRLSNLCMLFWKHPELVSTVDRLFLTWYSVTIQALNWPWPLHLINPRDKRHIF